jgi:hypothetical protein
MAKLDPTQFNGSARAPAPGQTDAGAAAFDKLMPQSESRLASKPRQRPAAQRQTPAAQRQTHQRQLPPHSPNVNGTVNPRASARPNQRTDLAAEVPQRTLSPRPQQVTSQKPASSPHNVNVNVTGVFERGPTSTNFGKKVTVSESFALKKNWQLKTEISVQGNSGTSVTAGQIKPTSSTTIRTSVAAIGKFATSSPNTSITAEAKLAGEINNSATRTTAKAELGVTVRADQKIDKTTSAYVTVGGKTVISSVSTPTTTLAAELGLNKVLSADGKLNGSLYGGVEQTLGANAVPYVGMKGAYKLDQTTSVLGEIKVKKDSSEVKLGVGFDI